MSSNETDLLRLAATRARRITLAERISIGMSHFKRLGLELDEVQAMASVVGLEVDDLCLEFGQFSSFDVSRIPVILPVEERHMDPPVGLTNRESIGSRSTAKDPPIATDEIVAQLRRIADHFDPPPANIVGTPYVAQKLNCTTVWVTEMIRLGHLPRNCVVPGTGNGKPWKFYRVRIDQWIECR